MNKKKDKRGNQERIDMYVLLSEFLIFIKCKMWREEIPMIQLVCTDKHPNSLGIGAKISGYYIR